MCVSFLCNQQQQLNTPCDEETAAVLNDCYMLEEKERLKEEWRTFEEQRKNFEMERRSFTEAAIRLGHEVIGHFPVLLELNCYKELTDMGRMNCKGNL